MLRSTYSSERSSSQARRFDIDPAPRSHSYHISVAGTLPVAPDYTHRVLPLSLSERRFGRFDVSLVAPHGLAHDEIDASMADGVLRIELPKKSCKVKEQSSEVKIA